MNLHTSDKMFTHSHKPLLIYRQSYTLSSHLHRGPVYLNFFSQLTKREGHSKCYNCKWSLWPHPKGLWKDFALHIMYPLKIKSQHPDFIKQDRLQGHIPDSFSQNQAYLIQLSQFWPSEAQSRKIMSKGDLHCLLQISAGSLWSSNIICHSRIMEVVIEL